MNTQPQLDTTVYNVKFLDGHFERYSSNILSEALAESIDPDGYQVGFIKEICGYRADEGTAVLRKDSFVYQVNGQPIPKIMTKGWNIKVR